MTRQHSTRIVFGIFILALVVRLAPVVVGRHLGIGLDDMFQYDMLARSLVAGNGYRWYAQPDLNLITRYISIPTPPDYDPRGVLTSHRAPLYPLFLASVYALSGLKARFFAARFLQTMLGALLAPGTFLLARQLGRSRRAGYAAALTVALYPTLTLYPLALATENIFWPLLLFSMLVLLRARRMREAALAGALLGAAALTRSIIAGAVIIAAVWLWRTRGARYAAVLTACFLAMTIPWSVRNTLVHGRPIFIESSLGYNLYLGYHPQSSGTFQYGISLDLLTILDDAERDAQGRQLAWEYIRANPARVPYLAIRKLGYFWGLEKRAPMYFYSNNMVGHLPNGLLALVFIALCAPLVILLPAAIVGTVASAWNKGKTVLVLVIGYYAGVHMLVLAEDRFHLALIPFLAALAGRTLPRNRWLKIIAILLIALALLNWGWELARDWPVLLRLFSATGNVVGLDY